MINADQTSVPKAETLKLGISGMTCDHCVRRVERLLRAQPGISDVKVDRAAALAWITYDPQRVKLPEVHEALRAGGYPASAIPAAP
jgi:copper chaperone CopZ